MHALILGGAGFIGTHVARALAAQGCRVTIYHSGAHEPDLPHDVQHVHDPRARLPMLEFPHQLAHVGADVVVHMQAMGDADTAAAVRFAEQHAQRLVVISSGDVYRAYGRLIGIESGDPDPMPLDEDAPLRTSRFPYRAKAESEEQLEYWYDKLLVERRARDAAIPSIILRLGKVYGPGGRDNFAATYMAHAHPEWRWTHVYVENVAHAVMLAATLPALESATYNVGELVTPTVGERLQLLPPRDIADDPLRDFDFRHDLVLDSSRIRAHLGYCEAVDEETALQRTLSRTTPPQ